MTCSELFDAIGFRCQQLPQESGSPVYHIATPFETFDGDGVRVFAEINDGVIRVFDAGYTIFHITSVAGIHLHDGRSIQPIKRLVEAAGAELTDDWEISMHALYKDASTCVRKVMSAIIAVAAWEHGNVGIPTHGADLASEVELMLRQWKPAAAIEKDHTNHGISGKEYDFDFYQDGVLIDAVSAHPQATASKIRKLADLRGVPSQAELPIMIIIDDRADATLAQQESAIIAQFATVRTVGWLQKQLPQMSMSVN